MNLDTMTCTQKKLNINRKVDDAFYRYKMPSLVAKPEGIKTVITNMTSIANALARPPIYLMKYFAYELGVHTREDAKTARFVMNGSHTCDNLQDLLDGFIRKFVLCQECENPETNLVVAKQTLSQRCIACGHSSTIDRRHKLTAFICKNSSQLTRCRTEAHPPKVKRVAADYSHDCAVDDEDWCEDTSDAAVQSRIDSHSVAVRTLTRCNDSEKSTRDRIDMFYFFVKEKKREDRIIGPDREKAISREADRLDVKDQAPLILTELLFDTDILQQIIRYRSLFSLFTTNNMRAQRYLIGGIEQLVGIVYRDVLLKRIPHILKTFYDMDILTEECIVNWNSKISKFVSAELSAEIRVKSQPFISWLNEAEEESSDDEIGEPISGKPYDDIAIDAI